jgi:hypothetical protein
MVKKSLILVIARLYYWRLKRKSYIICVEYMPGNRDKIHGPRNLVVVPVFSLPIGLPPSYQQVAVIPRFQPFLFLFLFRPSSIPPQPKFN